VGKHDTIHGLWETLIETTIEAVGTVAALAVAEGVAASEVEDLLLAEAGVTIEETEKCLMLPAATVENRAKFLLDPQMVNLFTAAIVLKRWAEEATGLLTTDQDLTIELLVLLRYKADRI